MKDWEGRTSPFTSPLAGWGESYLAFHLPARRVGKDVPCLSPPRSPGRSAAQPPGGEGRTSPFTSPLAGEVGGAAAGWGRSYLAFHLPARRGGRRRSRRVGRVVPCVQLVRFRASTVTSSNSS